MNSRVEPLLVPATAEHRGVLVWRWAVPVAALSSAPVGGGFGAVEWVLNIGVPSNYDRTDLAEHAHQTAAELLLRGAGIAMFTAVDVNRLSKAEYEGVAVDATVGIRHPTWAADPTATSTPAPDARASAGSSAGPGTINLVIQMPVTVDPGAAVNTVMTATEAKTQALSARGVQGTGTATDAVTVLWPAAGRPEQFAGPRSKWGSRIAQAVYQAVWAGADRSR